MHARQIEAHVYITAVVLLLAALLFSVTTADARAAQRPLITHGFTGQVLEIREVALLGNTRAQVARVQADFGAAWVILRIEPGRIARNVIALGEAQTGDRVRVFIAGPHVFPELVDWSACRPIASDYCQFGAIYEAAPLSLDWNVPLSPSNEFIHYGHAGPHYANALYWFTSVLDPSRQPHPGDARRDSLEAGPGRVSCLAGTPHERRSPVAR